MRLYSEVVRRALWGASLAVITCLGMAVCAAAAPEKGDPGSVRMFKRQGGQDSTWDLYHNMAFFRRHYWRAMEYPTWFDRTPTPDHSFLSRYPRAMGYQDSMAWNSAHDPVQDAKQWWYPYVLKDTQGRRLWNNWGGSKDAAGHWRFPQYQMDISDPAYQDAWIAQAKKRAVNLGYKGLWVDDVNLNTGVVVTEDNARPTFLDHQTGKVMDEAAWNARMADFMARIRAALPGIEILHNSKWDACGYAWYSAGDMLNPTVVRQLQQADYVNMESLPNDNGLNGGDPKAHNYTLAKLLAYVDQVHALGKGVCMDDNGANSAAQAEYGLAAYFLVSNGYDSYNGGFGNDSKTWWPGYETHLGAPKDRYARIAHSASGDNYFTREFRGGLIVLADPEGRVNAPVSLLFPGARGAWRDVNGGAVYTPDTTVRLEKRQALILVKTTH